MPLTPALGTPLEPLPLMSLQATPALTVCQTCPTPMPPITTQASFVLAGLNAMPPIHALGSTTLATLKGGRPVPVMSVQVGGVAVALVLMNTLPSVLAVITTVAFDGPVTISCRRSGLVVSVFA